MYGFSGTNLYKVVADTASYGGGFNPVTSSSSNVEVSGIGSKTGYRYLNPVRAMYSAANLSLTAVSTNVWSFAQIISLDGLTIVAGNRILLTNQTDAKLNGVYECTSVASSQCFISRPLDFALNSTLYPTEVLVTAGTNNANKIAGLNYPNVDATGVVVDGYVGLTNQVWTARNVSTTTTLVDSGNGSGLCNANFRLNNVGGIYSYMWGSGGNANWYIGGNFNSPAWDGTNIGGQGDGVALSYHVLPDKSRTRTDVGGARVFVGYSYVAAQFCQANANLAASATTGSTTVFIDSNSVSSRNILPFSFAPYNLGQNTNNLRWQDIFSVNNLTVGSDMRMKEDVKTVDLHYALEILKKLRPVSYLWKENSHGRRHTGFIAQEVEQSLGDLASEWGFFIHTPAWDEEKKSTKTDDDDNNDEPEIIHHADSYGLRYHELISPMVAAIQCLSEKVDSLEKQFEVETESGKRKLAKFDMVDQETDLSIRAILEKVLLLESKTEEMSKKIEELTLENEQLRADILD